MKSPWPDNARQLLAGVADDLTDDQLRQVGERIEREVDVFVDVFFAAIAVTAVAGLAVGAFGGLLLGVLLGNPRPR